MVAHSVLSITYLTIRLKTIFLLNLVKYRLGLEIQSNMRQIFLDIADQNIGRHSFEKFLMEITLDRPKLNVKWIYIFTEIYKNDRPVDYLSLEAFEYTVMQLRNSITSYKELEHISKSELDVFLKDIALEGHLEILIFDYVMAKEVSNLNDLIA